MLVRGGRRGLKSSGESRFEEREGEGERVVDGGSEFVRWEEEGWVELGEEEVG